MYEWRDKQVMFLDGQKTASRSVRAHLADHWGPWDNPAAQPHVLPGKRIKRLHERGWDSFTVVRNPYHQLASEYWFRHVYPGRAEWGGRPFRAWLLGRGRNLTQTRRAKLAGHVVKFEDLQEGLAALPFWPGGTLPHHNQQSRPPLQEVLTPVNKRLIRRQWGADFNVLGYGS